MRFIKEKHFIAEIPFNRSWEKMTGCYEHVEAALKQC